MKLILTLALLVSVPVGLALASKAPVPESPITLPEAKAESPVNLTDARAKLALRKNLAWMKGVPVSSLVSPAVKPTPGCWEIKLEQKFIQKKGDAPKFKSKFTIVAQTETHCDQSCGNLTDTCNAFVGDNSEMDQDAMQCEAIGSGASAAIDGLGDLSGGCDGAWPEGTNAFGLFVCYKSKVCVLDNGDWADAESESDWNYLTNMDTSAFNGGGAGGRMPEQVDFDEMGDNGIGDACLQELACAIAVCVADGATDEDSLCDGIKSALETLAQDAVGDLGGMDTGGDPQTGGPDGSISHDEATANIGGGIGAYELMWAQMVVRASNSTIVGDCDEDDQPESPPYNPNGLWHLLHLHTPHDPPAPGQECPSITTATKYTNCLASDAGDDDTTQHIFQISVATAMIDWLSDNCGD